MNPRWTDAIFYNGSIYTMDEERPLVRAVATSEGRIVKLGDLADVKRTAPRGSDRYDLGGLSVIPGFIDCHTHFIQMGLDAMSVDLSQAKSIDEALESIRRAAEKTPEGEWVVAANWKESGWKDGRFITRADLDSCSPRNPAVAHRVCGHLSSVNTAAIKELGIGPKTEGAETDASGDLTGVLRESAVALVREATAPSRQKKMKALVLATRKAHSLGVTSIHDNGQGDDFGVFREAEAAGRLGIRVWFNMPAQNLGHLSALYLASGVGSEWLKLGGLKVFCDGAIGARTAALSEPYADDPGNKGMFVHTEKEMFEIADAANERGIQLAIHAIGDRGIERAIGSIEKAVAAKDVLNRRHRIEHLELPSRAHLVKMRKLRIIASMQPNFVGEWGGTNGMYLSRLGPERTVWNNPFREVLKSRVRMVFGSDCMPMSPLYGIWSAVSAPHRTQKLSPHEAVRAYTREAAYASFEERTKGTLAEGKVADFVVLSHDPFEDQSVLPACKVMKTVIGGRVVYEGC